MTLEEGIRYFEEHVEYYKNQKRGLDNLPGIYYDAKDYERCRIGVENNQQFVDWLKELKEYREKDNSIGDIVEDVRIRDRKSEIRECINTDTAELLANLINDIDAMKADIKNIKSDMIVRRIKGE